MTARAAIYARVSSAKQRDAHTIESQLGALRRYVEAQGWSLVGEYVDDGHSAKAGKLDERDGFARLAIDADAHAFDVLVVFDISRLTRTDSMHERAQILGPFQRNGIDIVTPSGGRQDLRTMLGELYITLHSLFAAEDNRKRASAVISGKQRAIAEGRKPAGPTPYGLVYTRATGKWSLHPVRAPIVVEAFARVIDGESCLEVADDFHERGLPPPRKKWDRHAVWRLVRSRHPVGEWLADKRKHLLMRVPEIITEATWAACQHELMEHGKRGLVKTKHTYLLERIAKCAACGQPISIRSSNAKDSPAAYVCRSRKLALRAEVRCTAEIVKVAETDELVWSQIAAALDSRDLITRMQRLIDQRTANRHSWEADVRTYREKLEKLGQRETGILTRYQRGAISEQAFDTSLASFRRERAALELQIKTAEDQATEVDSVPQVDAKRWLDALRALARKASPVERQRIVRMLVKAGSAVLDRGTVRLTLLVKEGSGASNDSADVLAVGSG